jgi:hypothetical protein
MQHLTKVWHDSLAPFVYTRFEQISEWKSPNRIITEHERIEVCRRWESTMPIFITLEQGDRDIYRSRKKARRECLFGRHSRGHYVSISTPNQYRWEFIQVV